MKRKLVKQGPATLMVSLPVKWLQSQNLNKGDEVDIEVKDNKIVNFEEVFFDDFKTDYPLQKKS